MSSWSRSVHRYLLTLGCMIRRRMVNWRCWLVHWSWCICWLRGVIRSRMVRVYSSSFVCDFSYVSTMVICMIFDMLSPTIWECNRIGA